MIPPEMCMIHGQDPHAFSASYDGDPELVDPEDRAPLASAVEKSLDPAKAIFLLDSLRLR